MNNDARLLAGQVWAPQDGRVAGLGLYALVDHAGAPGLLAQLGQRPAIRWRNLFEGSREADAIEVAPILIELSAMNRAPGAASRALLAWLIEKCAASNALLWLHSGWTLNALAPALMRRLDTHLPDNMQVLLRYFDSRVFVAMLDVLDRHQRANFLGVASRWSWLDRAGRLQDCGAEPAQAFDPMNEPLTLNATQEAALIDAAEADVVILEMRKQAPDVCEQSAPAVLYESVRACLPVAHRHGISDVRQQALFCIVEIEAGPRFYEQPAWQQALQQASRDGCSFMQVVRAMEST